MKYRPMYKIINDIMACSISAALLIPNSLIVFICIYRLGIILHQECYLLHGGKEGHLHTRILATPAQPKYLACSSRGKKLSFPLRSAYQQLLPLDEILLHD
uniref:Uncharacterized protein n=1 Tax=Cacopsylla melanoneura TaxID=428564 RepID=A0A8D8YV53_9HEMI